MLLGPKFPALFYLCGPWDEDAWPQAEDAGLAVELLDKAYSIEVRLHLNLVVFAFGFRNVLLKSSCLELLVLCLHRSCAVRVRCSNLGTECRSKIV